MADRACANDRQRGHAPDGEGFQVRSKYIIGSKEHFLGRPLSGYWVKIRLTLNTIAAPTSLTLVSLRPVESPRKMKSTGPDRHL